MDTSIKELRTNSFIGSYIYSIDVWVQIISYYVFDMSPLNLECLSLRRTCKFFDEEIWRGFKNLLIKIESEWDDPSYRIIIKTFDKCLIGKDHVPYMEHLYHLEGTFPFYECYCKSLRLQTICSDFGITFFLLDNGYFSLEYLDDFELFLSHIVGDNQLHCVFEKIIEHEMFDDIVEFSRGLIETIVKTCGLRLFKSFICGGRIALDESTCKWITRYLIEHNWKERLILFSKVTPTPNYVREYNEFFSRFL